MASDRKKSFRTRGTRLRVLIIAGLLLAGTSGGRGSASAAAKLDAEHAPSPAQIPVPQTGVSSEQQLKAQSDLVVIGKIRDDGTASYPTGESAGGLKIVHYVQTIHVEDTWKGPASRTVRLLTSGVEPLPDADNPLNKRYTGPLAGGEYVCFLKKSPGTDYYTLTGIWQGLYPMLGGKSNALLANGGFAAFDQLSSASFKNKVTSMRSLLSTS